MAPKRSGSPTPLGKAKLAVTFVGVSVLSGVLIAGIALPAVGTVGLTAKSTANSFDDIPADFKAPPLSQASFIYDAKGGLIAKVFDRDRTVVKFDDIAPVMRQAQVDIEDARFYQHGAVDPKGMLRALTNNAETGDTQGASTLTQQYVKNVFVEEAGDSQKKFLEATRQTLGRKIQELKYAIQVEDELSKNQILTNYMDITFYGNQAYGIEAASQVYFNTHAKDLTLTQAALLAGLVQNPSAYDPVLHPTAAKARRDTVLQTMEKLKHITKAQADKAIASPLGLKYTPPQNGCITAKKGMGFFCDYVRNVIKTDPAFGKTKTAREQLLDRGGLSIYTTLDPTKQKAAEKAITDGAHPGDKVAAAATMVQPGTGKILAMAQSRPYGLDANKHQTQINYNAGVPLSAGTGQPVGSTFKAVTAAAAIEAGETPNLVLGAPYQINYPAIKLCEGSTSEAGPTHNESPSEAGPYAMWKAMDNSVNTYFIQLEQKIGLCPVQQMADNLGLGTTATGAKMVLNDTTTLGTNSYSPLQMANAYAAFANDGVYCAPVAITSVVADGKQLSVPKPKCQRAMSSHTAATMNSLLLGVTENGTGTLAQLPNGWQSAGKTGTTDDPKDSGGDGIGPSNAWFTGYTSNLSTSVWLGDPTQARDLDNMTIGGHGFYGLTPVQGATGPAPIWRAAVTGALNDEAPPSLAQAPFSHNNPKAQTPANTGTPSGQPADSTSTDQASDQTPNTPLSGLLGNLGGGKGGHKHGGNGGR